MAFATGERINFNALIKLGDVPVYRLGQQGNQHDPEEEAKVKEAIQILSDACFITHGPGPRKTLLVTLYEPPEGPAEIAGQNG